MPRGREKSCPGGGEIDQGVTNFARAVQNNSSPLVNFSSTPLIIIDNNCFLLLLISNHHEDFNTCNYFLYMICEVRITAIWIAGSGGEDFETV